MTGTVLDGNIDVALLKTDGEQIESFGRYTLAPYTTKTVELLREAVDQANRWQFDGTEPDIFAEASRQLTIEQSNAVKRLVEEAIYHLTISVWLVFMVRPCCIAHRKAVALDKPDNWVMGP